MFAWGCWPGSAMFVETNSSVSIGDICSSQFNHMPVLLLLLPDKLHHFSTTSLSASKGIHRDSIRARARVMEIDQNDQKSWSSFCRQSISVHTDTTTSWYFVLYIDFTGPVVFCLRRPLCQSSLWQYLPAVYQRMSRYLTTAANILKCYCIIPFSPDLLQHLSVDDLSAQFFSAFVVLLWERKLCFTAKILPCDKCKVETSRQGWSIDPNRVTNIT